MNAREPFFELERLVIKAYSDGNINDSKKYSQLYNEKLLAGGVGAYEHGLDEYICRSRMTPEIITTLAGDDSGCIQDDIDEKDFKELKSYVEDLLKVNLKHVRMIRAKPLNDEEARAFPCGKYNHVISIPPVGQGFISRDLVVHELAHTAEFNIRRQNAGLEFLASNIVFSEVMASLAQFSYLLNFGDLNRRKAALGAFVFSYFSVKVFIAVNCLKCVWDDVVNHEMLFEFKHEYSVDELIPLINRVRMMLSRDEFAEKVIARFSTPMAVRLLGHVDKVRALALHDIRLSVQENLDKFAPDVCQAVLDFTNLESLFSKFIDGTIMSS